MLVENYPDLVEFAVDKYSVKPTNAVHCKGQEVHNSQDA